MIETTRVRRVNFKDRKGFTLIELLIVIIVLGILAMVIVPQITVSTEDAKVSTLKSSLTAMRSAIETYYAQHQNKYPGQTKQADGTANADATEAAASMVLQLTQYTDINGKVAAVKDDTYKYGPYVKGGALPTNPFNNLTTVKCDATTDITTARAADNTVGWKFHFITGVFYSADNLATAGVNHTAY